MKWSPLRWALVLSLALAACAGKPIGPLTVNDEMSHAEALDLAETVVLAEVVTIEGGDADTERVTIRPLVTFAGALDVATDGTYSFSRPADEPDFDGDGYWLFDHEGAPLIRPDGDDGFSVPSMPWPPTYQYVIFERYPASVPATELLEAADIVVVGHEPMGAGEAGDDQITIDIVEVLRGESELAGASAVLVEIGDAYVEPRSGDNAFLIDETPDGSLRLVDTWVAMPWSWDTPVLGDALRRAFPDAAPPTT